MAASSLAKRLRAAVSHDDEERFELANYTELQAHQLVEEAFSSPLQDATEPLRFTFIIGGGKLVRHKFDEQLGKYLTAALRKQGYEEDKGASVGSSKCFKQQHDTGQNLIYLHVFPELAPRAATAGAGGGAGGAAGGDGDGGAVGFDMSSPPVRCISCETFDFKKLIDSRVPSWLQRRRLLQLLQDAVRQIEAMEAKMIAREPLTPVEQAKYDMASRQNLEDKVAALQAAMKEQVSEGALTAAERATVLSEMEERLRAMADEQARAVADGHEKDAVKIAAQKAALTGRRDAVKAAFAASAAVTRPVRGISDIRAARATLTRLDKVAASLENPPKPLAPADALARRTELDKRPVVEAQLADLEKEAKFWFETDAEFEERVLSGIVSLGGSLKGAGRMR